MPPCPTRRGRTHLFALASHLVPAASGAAQPADTLVVESPIPNETREVDVSLLPR